MGANGQHASGVLEQEGNRRWKTVDTIDSNTVIIEMKPVSGNKRPGVKLPEESHTPNRVYAIMYPKNDPNHKGIKAIAKYGPDGKKIFEIHTSDHKGMGVHHHNWTNGRPGPAIAGLTSEMQTLLDKIKNHG